ncbi:septal ring lytic transglycosylase RlpA family protein [Variovorax sp. J22P168]|uniref:septal ring lytic transglycosylase RlpA family protein n=1 Tax=Variovorax jilinensis TaxID=3053513 RepID=UPI0025791843|nr:septal ring lytic transglycosylase RlpA family protein [Variovorax sp. J22P168]MDM0014114.1 septal ring lytic transglycosylase RlpA family protein [Variovorax sp. J22P168]
MAEPGHRDGSPALVALGSAVCAALLVLSGCASGPRGGRDGAAANPPSNLSQVPDAEPRIETLRSSGGTSKPYVVLGRSYTPITDDRPLRESGLASWYGTKFHGQPTASGEPYDMYAMTAAHKTLPLPSYVRVRNPANGREAIVRVNDRGPFHDDRVIDLSYTAALKLDLLRGVGPVEIERITNEDIRTGAWRRGEVPVVAAAQVPAATAGPEAAAGAVVVPSTLTSPVVASSRFDAMQITALPPMAPLAPVSPAASAPAQPLSSTQTPAAAPPAPRSGVAMQSATPGFWVQIGAFSQAEGAQRFQQQVASAMPPLAGSLNVFSEGGTHRVQSGPYASREQARDSAEQFRNGLRLAPVIVERR